MTTWTPGNRRAQRQLEAPYELVPDHLSGPLWEWINGHIWNDDDLIRRIGIEFRIQYTSAPAGYLNTRCAADAGFELDLIEFLLETQCARRLWGADSESAEGLEEILERGNSVYKVNEAHDGLEMRTTPEVQAQVQQVVNTATGSAGDHLADAWNEAYSRTPDPVKSYGESIKAVEAALAPIVSPNHLRATLGTLIGDVNADPARWKFVIADGNVTGVDTVLHMMRMLHTSSANGAGSSTSRSAGRA